MKKIWDKFSYAIILVGLSFAFATVVMGQAKPAESEYMKITVKEGESLWQISQNFSEDHSMTTAQFVQWVEKKNGVAGDQIFPGDELIIPVSKQKNIPIELADAPE